MSIAILQSAPLINASEIKRSPYVLSIESSQVSRTNSIPDDLTSNTVDSSKILVYSVFDKKILFSYTPPISDFKNANEILLIDNDLYVVYYWNSVDLSQKSRLIKFQNLRVDLLNYTLDYDDLEIVDIGVNTIHGSIYDETNIYFTSRRETKICKLQISAPLADLEVFDLGSSGFSASADSLAVYGDNWYLPTYAGFSPIYTSKVSVVKVSEPTTFIADLISFENESNSSSPPIIMVYKDHAYITQNYFAYSSNYILHRINLTDQSAIQLTVILDLPGDPHSFAVDPSENKMFITTGRNPQVSEIDLISFSQINNHIIRDAQTSDPIPFGYYGSPETGYITDDIAFGSGHLFMGSELGKPGFVVLNTSNFNDSSFYPTTYDVFGSTYVELNEIR